MIKSLYVHIPFCLKKCLYCDFNSYPSLELQDEYVNSLLWEIDSLKIDKMETIFVGGGTPTSLSIENFQRVLSRLKTLNPKEFTIEANPGTLDDKRFHIMKTHGINRISMGLQAWQDNLLKELGRIHTLEDFLESFESARKWGFENINVDLMFGLPGQNMQEWEETLKKTAALKPEHISAYGLIIEEGTPFYKMNEEGRLILPDEDVERDMYDFAVNYLGSLGYRQYEISNFSLEGHECRHNITYWRDEEYYGVGSGAHSYIGRKRISNKSGIMPYINGIKISDYRDEENTVSPEDEMSEYMFLGLRMTSGISISDFKNRFGLDIFAVYPRVLDELKKQRLLEFHYDHIRLTKLGIQFSNQVFVRFIR